jgi:hypothetical protein
MPQTYREVLTEVFIRTLENHPELSINEAVARIQKYYEPDNDTGWCPELVYGAYAGDRLLYESGDYVDTFAIRQEMFAKSRLLLLQRLIKDMDYDIRETSSLLENDPEADESYILNKGSKSEVEAYYQNLRKTQSLPELSQEIMLRLLQAYPKIDAKFVGGRLISISSMSTEEKQQYPLGKNYPSIDMLIKKINDSDRTPNDMHPLLFQDGYLTSIDKLRELSYDTRELFTLVNENNFNKIASLTVTSQQMEVIEDCLRAMMLFTAVHTDCREAD